ncbi:DUF1622 domain-containing protein [Arthrobacter sp. BL-252-APC-1A]|uniref:DUF1622 domain-containing protein n=1 Tax=Arthrobacter sp. BL-252-APC-1A TaxID=2606622 RepID=UPI0012B188C7|nr:DUF1622 domain-containing protein [Arthrobacter sp. BL-252-APC-1A]MSR99801.1 DUF1622 domain-containing protein [Arthrobacter sp. BL-252-APC-1A]
MDFQEIIETVGAFVDLAGVAAIVAGAVVATVIAVRGLVGRRSGVYELYRQQLGRAILLGLELLVAADIIRTVAVTPTFESLGVLAVIVLIRTFLSYSLQLEVTGRLPWQGRNLPSPAAPGR